jgi:thiamine biosynthesis lipoprotein
MTTPVEIRLPQRHVEQCMGTVFSFDIRSPGVDRAALDSVIVWLRWVDATFSTYRPDSQVSRLACNDITPADCVPEVREILDRCAELEAETEGYFNAWPAGRLDPSGLVKGWAIQQASELLHRAGSTNHCVNGGGDVQCMGSPAAGSSWRIGIAHPLQPTELVGIAAGNHLAVATSGSAERGAHIIDPHTRTRPSALVSVTLIGRDLATTDAYATAAYAMGAAGTEWIETLEDHRGLVVRADGSVWAEPTSPADATPPRSLRTPPRQTGRPCLPRI